VHRAGLEICGPAEFPVEPEDTSLLPPEGLARRAPQGDRRLGVSPPGWVGPSFTGITGTQGPVR
jgi:hypothetical protein